MRLRSQDGGLGWGAASGNISVGAVEPVQERAWVGTEVLGPLVLREEEQGKIMRKCPRGGIKIERVWCLGSQVKRSFGVERATLRPAAHPRGRRR